MSLVNLDSEIMERNECESMVELTVQQFGVIMFFTGVSAALILSRFNKWFMNGE